MTKTGWTVVIACILLVLIGGFAYVQMRAPAEVAATPAEPQDALPSAPMEDVQAAVTVTYTDSGYNPETVTVAVGDTVRFVNDSSRGMWTASDAHPTHTEYDGTSTREHCAAGAATNGTFDECSPANPGEHYTYTFTKAGTFEYHNHVNASDTGTVIVK